MNVSQGCKSRQDEDWSLTAKANVDKGWLYDTWNTEFVFGIFEKNVNYVNVTTHQNCANIVEFIF